jgi:FKBP-type peptidyl-prolyl cis-trans isomerase FkpA/FKBP-type peptidyl-prolyl cis-trans isomerase FklB
MRTIATVLTLAVLLLASAARAADPELKTDEDKAFYAFGLNLSQQLGGLNLTEHDLDVLKIGLTDGVLKHPPKVEGKQYQTKFQEIAKARMTAGAAIEKKAGQEFAEKAAKEKGAKKTDSGMVYQEVTPGTGESPKATDKVKVHYTGTLTDGTKFDSSVDRGEPATFPLNQVIKCWTEGVQLMKVGGKAKLICPSDIAYGDTGRPPTIKPGSTLVFEIELLSIEK